MLNLKDSVLSEEALVKGLVKEKFIGPIGVITSTANPVELLIVLELSSELS